MQIPWKYPDQCQGYVETDLLSLSPSVPQGASLGPFLLAPVRPIERVKHKAMPTPGVEPGPLHDSKTSALSAKTPFNPVKLTVPSYWLHSFQVVITVNRKVILSRQKLCFFISQRYSPNMASKISIQQDKLNLTRCCHLHTHENGNFNCYIAGMY